MNRILRPLALAAGLAIGSGAHAGIPVIDNVAIVTAGCKLIRAAD